MAADEFFARWSKQAAAPQALVDDAPALVAAPSVPLPLPTLDDAAALCLTSDFRPFVARGVDQAVQRLALKKLFTDPHFNVMDGLDTYIEDFNNFVPMTADMVAALNHGKALLDPLAQLQQPLMRLLEPPSHDSATAVDSSDAAVHPEAAEIDRDQPEAQAEFSLCAVPLSTPEPLSTDRPAHFDDPIQSL